jgi:hypothetical protein
MEVAFATSGIDLPVPYLGLSAQVIRDLPLACVADLQRFEANLKSGLAALATMIQGGLDLRFAEQARTQLHALGRDTGTTHITDGEYDIAIEIGKDTQWDQRQLQAIWSQIAASGEDPAQYIVTKYSVSEAKFKAWPDTLRQPFEAARTMKPKAPKFTLRRGEEGM